jgi:two-component system, response regulator PdtaR
MRKAILCVGDEKLHGSLKKRLKEQGFAEIIACSSIGDVVAKATDTLPEVAILEFSPRDTTVHVTAKKLWERLSIPIILIAERCDLEVAQKAGEAGISAILTTPLREEEMTAALVLSLAAARRMDALKGEVAALKETIESRKVVEKAKGRLMERDGLTEAEAFRRMQRLAMDRRISMRQLAEAILLTDRIGC